MNSLEAQWLVAVAVGAVMAMGFLAVYGYQRLRPQAQQASADAAARGPGPLTVPAQAGRNGALAQRARQRAGNRGH